MADTLKNLAGLFREGRTRTIILITFFVLLIAIVIGMLSIRGRVKGVEAAAGVSSAPGNIQSIPFNAPNEEYARLQEEQNKEKAQIAEKSGGTSIPTIIRANNNPGPEPTAVSDTGLGFTGLSREQSDSGTFSPKEFGANAKNCPIVAHQASPLGTAIYDKNGRLIGYSGADGKIRDINGNVIGSIGPEGIARDINGNVIGQTSHILPGTPIFDTKNCSLVGRVGDDGQVRDAAGNISGTLGSDGVLRSPDGKVLGQAGNPAYNPEGKLIGFACSDGKIRDANGNIIGTVGVDGIVRDLSGNIIGRTGAIPPGTSVYGADGKIIGTVGPDGKVRDADGNILGSLNADGTVKGQNGSIIGSIAKPAPVVEQPAKPEVAQPQKQIIVANPQTLQQQVSEQQQAMSNQANQLLAAWASPTQQLVHGDLIAQTQEQGGASASGSSNSQSSGTAASGAAFIKAGTVYYGVIDTSINSDEPGPVMATIVNGPYKGGKLLGSLTYQKQAVMLNFNILTLENFPKSIPVNVVAIDQDTARTGLSTETNNHYLYRYGSIFAAAFIQGYGQAFQTSGSTISTNGLSTQSSTPDLSPQGKFFVALGNVGQQFNTQAQQAFNTPPTVKVASGTAVGLLFLADAQLPS